MMKKILLLLGLISLCSACSVTSNDLNQNLLELPENATSYQCDSGNRIITQLDAQKQLQLQYRAKTYTFTQADENTYQHAEFEWQLDNMYAKLFTVKDTNSKQQIEQCVRVLQ